MKIIRISNKFCDLDMNWDWRWFGFELSFNNHDKYINVCFAWLTICIYVGRIG